VHISINVGLHLGMQDAHVAIANRLTYYLLLDTVWCSSVSRLFNVSTNCERLIISSEESCISKFTSTLIIRYHIMNTSWASRGRTVSPWALLEAVCLLPICRRPWK